MINKLIKLMTTCITLILVHLSIIAARSILPNGNERWKSPCGTRKDLITNITNNLEKAIENTNQTKYELGHGRKLNKDLMNCTDSGYYHLLEIPESYQNIIAKHQAAYKYLSIVAIFIEQVRINETIYQQNHNDALTENIQDIENTVYQVLCDIQSDLVQSKSYIIHHQSRDIMADNLRSMNHSVSRTNRDYVILNDTVGILQKFIIVYRDILTAIS